MSIQAKGGVITQKAATGTQAYTGVGFTPKLVIFWGGGQTAAGAAAHALFHFGAVRTPSPTDRFYGRISSRDNVGTSQTARSTNFDTACIAILDHTGASVGAADIVTFDSDGFTLDWLATDGTARKINYLALGGSDLSVAVGSFAGKGSTGTLAVTGVGFKPDALILFGTRGSAGTDAHMSMGFANADDEFSVSGCSEDAVGTSDTRSQLDNYIWQNVSDASDSIIVTASLSSLDSDGFTLNYSAASGTHDIYYIALKGCRTFVGSTSNGAASSPPDSSIAYATGFAPIATLVMTDGKASASPGPTADNRFNFGVGVSSSDQRSAGFADNDAVGTTESEQSHSETRFMEMFDNSATPALISSMQYDGPLTPPTSAGFGWTNKVHDGTPRYFAFLCIGPPTGQIQRSQAVCT